MPFYVTASISGLLGAVIFATSLSAQTCTHSKGNGSAVFTFNDTDATVEIRLGEALISQFSLQCGPLACTKSEDLGDRGGRLHHTMQLFPERAEVVYAALHEDFSARSTIQIYPVECTTP